MAFDDSQERAQWLRDKLDEARDRRMSVGNAIRCCPARDPHKTADWRRLGPLSDMLGRTRELNYEFGREFCPAYTFLQRHALLRGFHKRVVDLVVLERAFAEAAQRVWLTCEDSINTEEEHHDVTLAGDANGKVAGFNVDMLQERLGYLVCCALSLQEWGSCIGWFPYWRGAPEPTVQTNHRDVSTYR